LFDASNDGTQLIVESDGDDVMITLRTSQDLRDAETIVLSRRIAVALRLALEAIWSPFARQSPQGTTRGLFRSADNARVAPIVLYCIRGRSPTPTITWCDQCWAIHSW
jgi:hypothetical protein